MREAIRRSSDAIKRQSVLIGVRDPFTGVLWIVVPLPNVPIKRQSRGNQEAIT